MTDTVKISPRFQVVIPKAIREKMQLKAGQKLHVFAYGDRIELVPQRAIRNMRGFIEGLSTEVQRGPDRL